MSIVQWHSDNGSVMSITESSQHSQGVSLSGEERRVVTNIQQFSIPKISSNSIGYRMIEFILDIK